MEGKSVSENRLEMRGIGKSFYGIKVLSDARVDVKRGEVHVLLGENGAGKSTLIKILSSAYRREGGTIILDGEEVNFATPKEAIDNGISVIYQEFNLNPYVSIYENILLGKEPCKKGLIDIAKSKEIAKFYMDKIGLDMAPDTLVGSLSVAQKQMVEIAKAISGDVKILVLDEPTASITEKETQKLFEIVNELKCQGIGIIYISHRMSELFEIGDRCTVMRDGEYVGTVNLADVTVDDLTKMMVGHDIAGESWKNPNVTDEVILSVENLTCDSVVKDVSFELKRGEILGMNGLVGAGRTEIAKCIIGAKRYQAGEINFLGKSITGKKIHDTIGMGIAYLSEDRKDEGLILMHSLIDNVALPNFDKFGKFIIDVNKINEVGTEYLKKTTVKMSSPSAPAQSLSGGNQQKVVIAKWLLTDAKVYIFDEPTRGIDVGAREEIYQIMKTLVENGVSIIMISSDMAEILKMCNRVLVLKDGEIMGDLINDETLSQEKMLAYALGENKSC